MPTPPDARPIGIDRTLDLAGALLAALAAAWAVIAGGVAGGSPVSFLGVLAIAAAGLVAGRVAGRFGRRRVAVCVAGGIGLAFLVAGLGPGAWGDPLGYANASAALAVEGSIAALVPAMPGPPAPVRAAGLIVAAAFAAVPIALDARAAGLLIALVWISAFLVAHRRPRRGILGAGTAFVVVLAATVVLGAAYHTGPRTGVEARAVDASLTEIRVALWHDGLTLAVRHPLFGVGGGRFPEASAVARADPDTREAHNDFIQQGAEGGLPALALAALLVLWGFARLWATPRADAVTFLGAAALGAAALGASVDYILRFPAVVAAAAVLVGMGQAAGSGAGRTKTEAQP